jgi:hypothetical protein
LSVRDIRTLDAKRTRFGFRVVVKTGLVESALMSQFPRILGIAVSPMTDVCFSRFLPVRFRGERIPSVYFAALPALPLGESWFGKHEFFAVSWCLGDIRKWTSTVIVLNGVHKVLVYNAC